MKISDSQKKERTVKLVQGKPLSPHGQAMYEAGKAILIDSLDTARDFCKSMVGTSLSSIPTYLGILAFLLSNTTQTVGVLFLTAPAVGFLVSSLCFTFGYLPIKGEISLDSIDEIETERNRIIHYRRTYINLGLFFFTISVLAAILVVIIEIQ